MRRKARVDANQPELVEVWDRIGVDVQHLHTVGGGCPDVLLSVSGLSVTGPIDLERLACLIREQFPEAQVRMGVHIPVEIKNLKGKLTGKEVEWWNERNLEPIIAHDTESALRVVGR